MTVKERAEIERKINGRIVSAFSFTDNLGAELNEGRRRRVYIGALVVVYTGGS